MSYTYKRKRDGQDDDGSISSVLETPSKRKRVSGNFRGAYVAVPRLTRHPRPLALSEISPRKDWDNSKETLEIRSISIVSDMAEMNIDDEITDESNLVLPEETHEGGVHRELPVRYLDHFSIFDNESNRLISLDDAENPKFGKEPYFIGRATAKWEPLDEGETESVVETEEEDGDDRPITLHRTEVTVKSSPIQSIWESTEPEGPFASEKSEIWVQTQFAWYILERPSKQYRDLFLPRWLRHKLLLLMSYISPKTDSVHRFRKRFLRDEASWADYEFGRKLNLEDLSKFIPQTLQYITTLEDDLPVMFSSLFNKLCLEYCPKLSWSRAARSDDGYGTPSISSSKPYGQPPIVTHKDPRLTRTFCTPFIKTIAERYFPSLGEDEESSDEDTTQLEDTEIDDLINIEPPRLLPRIEVKVKSITGNHENLAWIKVNKQIYTPGDTVFIRPQSEEGMTKTEARPGELQDNVWFGRIIRLYRQCAKVGLQARNMMNDSDVYAHILWLLPASKTSIKELAHPQELIAIDECDNNIPVESFIGVCRNKLLGIDEREPTAVTDSLDFFYRYFWQRDEDDAFIDISVFLHDRLLHTPIDTPCPACDHDQKYRLLNEPRKTENGILFNGIEYHPLDFVYLLPDEPGSEYHIGQIEAIDCHVVKVHLLARQNQSSGYYDDRVLEDASPRQLFKFPTDHLEGKCNVTRCKPNELLDNDQFFCPNMDHWRHCKLCDHSTSSPPRVEPLRGLDIFSGAGGISLGLESVGLVKTQWAVEYDISSMLTFRKSHPDCVVYNACINALLRQAYDIQNGGNPTSVMSLEDGSTLPPLPEKGDVDIIYGGPPCQGFSRLNHCPKADDPRNHLVLTFISAVEMLQPSYVIMENVRGILFYRIGGRQASLNRIEGGIQCGMVKLVKRLLLSLNYQIRYGILHAGHYGAPQIRRRVIFIASKRGTYLPDLPQPSHVTPNTRLLNVVIDEKHSFTVNKRRMNSAPLGPVTVGDVIGDLPQWEWKNPHLIYPAISLQKRDEKARMKSILTIDGTHKPIETSLSASGPKHPMTYDIRPLTRYQQILRRHSKQLNQHWCPGFGAKEIERICSIPMVSDRFVDHNDLPSSLRIGIYGDKRHKGRYGRLNAAGVFTTMLGTLVPNNPGGVILHPTLHRIITIREMARSQGFPDRIEFLLEPGSRNIKKITKQIGNAVPIPMAAAIGKEVFNALRRTQQKDKEERESSVAL